MRDELDIVLGSKAILEYEDIEKLKYMALVLKETMRLYPSVSQIFRESRKGSIIGKYILKADTMIVVS